MSKTMKKMLSVVTVGALLVCMAIPTAFAATVTSVATVDVGSTVTAEGGTRSLYALPINGEVVGISNANGSLTGSMWTKGVMFSHSRDQATVEGYETKYLYWGNDKSETGTFWAECVSPSGNQGGQCTVSQDQ